MSMLAERNQWIEKVSAALKSTGVIGAVLTTGDSATESGDLRIVAVTPDGMTAMQAYARTNYVIKSELSPVSEQAISRDDYSLIKRYDMSDGVRVLVKVCSVEGIRTEEWWRPIFDRIGLENAAVVNGQKVDEDILCDMVQPEPEPEEEPEEDTFEEIADEGTGMDPVDEPVEPRVDTLAQEQPATPQPEEAADEENSEEAYWKFVSDSLRDACDAVADNALIRANEILNLLRRMAIELICVRNGVNENFERMIDKIDCPEKDMLSMTFPARHEQRAFLSALGVVSAIFDRLA